MLRLESVIARVFEDAANPTAPRRVSSRIMAYVKPSFADELRAGAEPLLNLRPLHRELLNRAITGETDEDLAESHGLSLPAIKSRWKANYAHIERQLPALAAQWTPPGYSGSARSRERRHLLNHLRQHLSAGLGAIQGSLYDLRRHLIRVPPYWAGFDAAALSPVRPPGTNHPGEGFVPACLGSGNPRTSE